ncbi:hypothetical protein N9Y42_00590 [Mariniblastus sp.]|nr:hypothetical protein [Mariniblastus sp.]
MKKILLSAVICTAFVTCILTTTAQCQNIIAFSNDFEDGDLEAEVGSLTLVDGSGVPSIVPVTGGNDATLGNNVALLDLNETTATMLDVTLNLTDTLSLADGNTVTLDFDVAARRTNGIAKVLFVDAMDRSGNIVVRFVLGDNNAFGNEGGDRQRPGYATSADGRLVFGNPPGSFWWGADSMPVEFDPARDAHMTLTIGASSFDFSSTRQDGNSFEATGLSNFEAVASTNIAEIKITSLRTGFGMYFDNIEVGGVVASDPPFVLGDCDISGFVDFDDIAPFIETLASGVFLEQADCDENDVVDFEDIAPFIRILAGS